MSGSKIFSLAPLWVAALLTSLAASLNVAVAAPPQPLPQLTPQGREVRRVVFITFGSGFCGSLRSDWRGDLPRHIVRYLPNAQNVVLHTRRDNNYRKYNNDYCRRCRDDFFHSGDHETRGDCRQMIGADQQKGLKADVVFIFGTGSAHVRSFTNDELDKKYEGLSSVLRLAHVGPDTVTVHFPIRRLSGLTAKRNDMNFTHVIEDQSFLKPLAETTVKHMDKACSARPTRKKDLLYIARFMRVKGQLEFLKQVCRLLPTRAPLTFFLPAAAVDCWPPACPRIRSTRAC